MSANQQRTRHCFPRSLFPWNGGTTGITVETAQQKKKNLVDGKKVKRQSDRNKNKQTGIHSMENAGVVSECPSDDMYFLLLAGLETFFLLDQKVTKPAYLLIQPCV